MGESTTIHCKQITINIQASTYRERDVKFLLAVLSKDACPHVIRTSSARTALHIYTRHVAACSMHTHDTAQRARVEACQQTYRRREEFHFPAASDSERYRSSNVLRAHTQTRLHASSQSEHGMRRQHIRHAPLCS